MVFVFGAFWDRFLAKDLKPRMNQLPKSGLGYIGLDLPMVPSEDSVYKRAHVLKRGYQYGLYNRFVLIVVDGSQNRHAVHDPLYCFRGAGWDIVINQTIPIEGGEARFLRLLKNGKERETLYWFSDGQTRHVSVGRYWFQTTLRRLTLGFSGQEPVMVILQPFGENPFYWQKIITQFGPLTEL